MNLISFTVYDLTTGKILRAGKCEEQYLPTENATHGVLVGTFISPSTHRVNPATGRANKLAVTPREEWRSSLPKPEPTELEVLTEALKANHNLTDAHLQAARARKLSV